MRRGSFKTVQKSIPSYAKQGISALYLMGNGWGYGYSGERQLPDPFMNKYSNNTEYRKEDASPLAAIDRSVANKMLGGE